MRGIRPYGKKFRAYVVDKHGQHHQRYFNTENEAENFILTKRKDAPGNSKYKKRANADETLPVGLYTINKKRLLANGGYSTTQYVVASAQIKGKQHRKSCSFGKLRTKEKAVEICLNWRNETLNKFYKTTNQ